MIQKNNIPIKPSNVMWSDEQWSAIYEDGKNILVSAGAGSGKTAVLSKRVIEKLKKGVSLKNLIVLTFTNAAAMEMKERIRKEIRKEIKEGNKEFKIEYNYIDQANIQTFDGFALELVKKYHYIINVDRNISICDEAMLAVKTIEVVNSVFEKHYEKNDEDFIKLIKFLCIKDDSLIKNAVIKINKGLDLITDRKEFVEKYNDYYFNESFCNDRINEYLDNLKLKKNIIKNILEEVSSVCISLEAKKYLESLHDSLILLFKANSYSEFKELNIKMPVISRKIPDEDKEIIKNEKEAISSFIKEIKELCVYDSLKDEILKIKENNNFVLKILELCEEVDNELYNFKRNLNIYSFMDIAKMAISLLKDSVEIRNNIKNNTNEILVDEYQDTSDIQEELISLISNNNVYMVGDVKQSIYRFRNANPKIFIDKYNKYKQDSNDDLVIDLSKNFRSREEVLKNINLIFENVMNYNYGGADYNNGHRLEFGNKKYKDYVDHNNNFEIYTYDLEKENTKLSKVEVEAMIIAKDIKNKIDNGYKVLSNDSLVNVSYRDFAILTQNKTHFEIYKKVFEAYEIPLCIHKEEMFSTSYEVIAINNCLKVIKYLNFKKIDNEFKYSLASFLRSFLIEIDENILAKIYLNDNLLDEFIKNCGDIYNKLVYLTEYSKINTLYDLVFELYNVFDVYGNIYKLENVEQVENRINYFLRKAEEMSAIGYSLDDFIRYFDNIKENDIEIKISEKTDVSDDVVNMLSIHKSKGLEYNICYFPSIDGYFKLTDLSDVIVFDKEYGIVMPVYNEGISDSFYKVLLRNRIKNEEISEKIRLFYVALTRAKDKFIIISKPFTDSLGKIDYSEYKKGMYNSIYSILSSIRSKFINYIKPIIFDENKSYKSKKYKVLDASDSVVDIKELQINVEKNKKNRASNEISGIIDKKFKDSLEYGTKIHKYFEVIDYRNYVDEIEILNEPEYIKNKLKGFYERLLDYNFNILNVYNEYEFYYDYCNESYIGIIDMFIECSNQYIIIDFKLSDINKDIYVNQLKVYENYIKKITSKNVRLFLYSIMNEEFKEII